MVCILECKSVFASMMLVHLLPDTRTAATASRIVVFINVSMCTCMINSHAFFSQEHSDASAEAMKLEQAQPIVIIRGTPKNPADGYLVCEKSLLSKINVGDLPIALFATYYVFNMQYCAGCINFFTFLEAIFLNIAAPKKTKINHLLNMLDNIE